MLLGDLGAALFDNRDVDEEPLDVCFGLDVDDLLLDETKPK